PSELDMGRDVRPFLENYHQMQKNSAAPQEQTAPPKPARSWAISGTRRGLKARNSSGLRPMKTRSCGTNTHVMPATRTVKPPSVNPTTVSSKQARPTPAAERHGQRTDGWSRHLIPSLRGVMLAGERTRPSK